MRFSNWLNQFMLKIGPVCVFDTDELKQAWRAGKDIRQLALDNDRFASEYDVQEPQDAA